MAGPEEVGPWRRCHGAPASLDIDGASPLPDEAAVGIFGELYANGDAHSDVGGIPRRGGFAVGLVQDGRTLLVDLDEEVWDLGRCGRDSAPTMTGPDPLAHLLPVTGSAKSFVEIPIATTAGNKGTSVELFAQLR